MKTLRTGLSLLIFMTILTGFIYPGLITVIAQLCFPWKANGSFIAKDNTIIGSLLIGQSFTQPQYFWSRPSATADFPYNAQSSGGSNLGPANPLFLQILRDRVAYIYLTNPQTPIPVDLITASASGLDPDISLASAYYQVPRIAKERHKSVDEIKRIIQYVSKNTTFGLLGTPRVNVLKLNLTLDQTLAMKVRP